MYSLSCKDLGEATCEYVATGDTKEDVMMKMKEHATSVHGKAEADMAGMQDMAMSMMKEM